MKVSNSTLAIIILVVLSTACAPKVYYQEAHNIHTGEDYFNDDSLDITVAFAADAYDFLIFEMDFINNTDRSLSISGEDINLYLYEAGIEDPSVLPMLDKDRLLYELESARETIQREKKAGTTLGIITAGLDLISIAFATGTTGVDAVFYSMESASYIFEGRRQMDLIRGDIEDQMEYIKDWIVDDELVNPGDTVSYDLLFERTLIDADAILEMKIGNKTYDFEYQFYIKEDKPR